LRKIQNRNTCFLFRENSIQLTQPGGRFACEKSVPHKTNREQLKDVFWGIHDSTNDRVVLTECMARKGELIAWKNALDGGISIACLTQIRPGGTGYEGVYAAYYYLSGLAFKEDALTGEGGNTLKYEIPVISNSTLPDWIGKKLDALRVGEHDFLQLPPMTPDEIKAKWFVE